MPKQHIAVTDIQITVEPGKKRTATTPAVRPVVKTMKAGTWFVPQSDAQEKELLGLGAIRLPGKKERQGVRYADLPISDEGAAEAEAEAEAAGDVDDDDVAAKADAEAKAKTVLKRNGRPGRKAKDDADDMI